MTSSNNYFLHSHTENPDWKDVILAELDKIKIVFPEEYRRLSELYQQGDMESVLQIIKHRKAVDQLKNLSPLL